MAAAIEAARALGGKPAARDIHRGRYAKLDAALHDGDLLRAGRLLTGIKATLAPVDLGREHPWQRYDWGGGFVTNDDTNTTGFEPDADNLLHVVTYGSTAVNDWDGSAAGIVILKDWRVCSWESTWGPTGSGFCNDAYGGDADICFCKTVAVAELWLSESARELLW